jgi:hypothetical protein
MENWKKYLSIAIVSAFVGGVSGGLVTKLLEKTPVSSEQPRKDIQDYADVSNSLYGSLQVQLLNEKGNPIEHPADIPNIKAITKGTGLLFGALDAQEVEDMSNLQREYLSWKLMDGQPKNVINYCSDRSIPKILAERNKILSQYGIKSSWGFDTKTNVARFNYF